MIDPETPITLELLDRVTMQLSLQEAVSPRLLYRIMRWACVEIESKQATIDAVKEALNCTK